MTAIQRTVGTSPLSTVRQAETTYTIRSGDSLSKIAKQFNTSVAELVTANASKFPGLQSNPNAIQVGWQLQLPGQGGDQGGGGTVEAPKSNDNVLLVGMNVDSRHEADQLRARGAKVDYVTDYKDDQVSARDNEGNLVNFDLTSPEGLQGFVKTLGLPAEQSAKIAEAIDYVGDDARDEMAQIAQVWAKAEHGAQIPSRVIFSGHSVGDGVWGDDNGTLYWESVGSLAAAMPEAARQVQDVHVAGCYSGGQPSVGILEGVFPKVETIWFYEGSAPGSYSGATVHQKIWEQATRGDNTDLRAALEQAKQTRKGENIAVWSRSHGYIGNELQDISRLESYYTSQHRSFEDCFSGGRNIPDDTQHSPLRDYYNTLQALRQHPDIEPERVDDLDAQRDQTIRLIYYSKTVAPKFYENYKEALQKGFDAVGLSCPDFGSISRKEALTHIAALEGKVNEAAEQPSESQWALKLLNEGLKDLNSRFIPDRWV